MQTLLALLLLATPVEDSAAEGARLLSRFECHRCHEGTGLTSVPEDKHCVRCHQSIIDGRFEASPDTLARWQDNLRSLRVVPSLAGAGRVLRRAWVESFLQSPRDLRPHLPATMPRLALSPDEARRLAHHMVPKEQLQPAPAAANRDRGRELYREFRCASCHVFSGSGEAFTGEITEPNSAPVSLAPDLALVRVRFQAAALVPWLLNPAALRPGTSMPNFGLSEEKAEALASFLWHMPLTAMDASPKDVVRTRIDRKVSYAEVEARVFRKVCWHCHSSPDYNRGDGGPGNTGGFGFAARGLDLSSYQSVAAGQLDAEGQRQSIFAPLEDGTPRLLAVLLARRAEERGESMPGVRGMPLGLPSLSDEEIQLVEAWIAQGRPR